MFRHEQQQFKRLKCEWSSTDCIISFQRINTEYINGINRSISICIMSAKAETKKKEAEFDEEKLKSVEMIILRIIFFFVFSRYDP